MENRKNISKYRHKISENRRLYSTLQSMKARCTRPTHGRYQYYGARGIKVCDEWVNPENGFDVFADWALSHGYTDEMTIERIDINGNYCPENCKWIPMREQARNKGTTFWVVYKGEKVSLGELCERLNLNYQTMHDRLTERGMTIEEAVERPIRENVTEFARKCHEHNIPIKIVKDRIRKLGWDEERALTTPPRICKRKPKN